ncbi:MAG: ArsC family reductase [Burkholderiales bacterium]|nr:ArsC family reductase [Burkholderiales bacterium]
MKLYGIPNCSTVKKARTWLAEHGHIIPFHDFRKDGISGTLLERWIARVNWQDLLNRKGTTWRQLGEDEKAAVTSANAAIALMLKNPSVIKRPVLESENRLLVGFDEQHYLSFFDE